LKKQNTISPMEWFAWGWIGVLLLLGLTKNGIFQGLGLHKGNVIIIYEEPLLYSFLIAIAAMLWVGVHFYQKQFKLEHRMIYALLASLLCLTYVISSFNSESPFLSHMGVLISVVVVVLFAAGTFLAQYDRIINFFPKIYLGFGYIIVAYGFLNLLGNMYLLDSLSFIDGVRITSIFQYANAYAAILLTLWIAILIEINRTTNRWVRIFHGFMLIPVCVSFLLTLSRGAIIMLPIIAIVTLLMFKLKQQIMILIYSGIGMGLSLLIYTHLEKAGMKVFEQIQQDRAEGVAFQTKSIFSSPSIKSWALLIAVSIVMGVIVQLIVNYIEPFLTNKVGKTTTVWAHRMVPIGLLFLFIIGAIAITSDLITQFLPEVIRARVGDVNLQTHSVYERLTMYGDAVEIWKENPLFGAGAGAWEALYEQHQSYSYISAQTHSFLSQLLVEVGLVGLIIYVGLIAAITFVFLRFYRKINESEQSKWVFYFIIPLTILLHSLIDFEMSYILFMVLVFLCLGVMAGTQRQPISFQLNKKAILRFKWVMFVIIVALVLVIAIPSGNQLYAIGKYKESEQGLISNQPFNKVVESLEVGLSKAHGHPVLLYQLALLNYQAYEQTKEDKYLEVANRNILKLSQNEPYYRQAVELGYAIALNMGDQERAIDIVLKGLNQYPYEQSLYDKAASELLKRWEELLKEGSTNAAIVASQITDLYDEMKRREQIILDLPETVVLNRTFKATETVRLAAEQVKTS